MSALPQNFWPSARHYAEAMQFPSFCFSIPELKNSQPAVDRLGMPLVTSGQFAYVYKLKTNTGAFAVRCFRGFLGDREARYKAIDEHLEKARIQSLASFDYDAEGILVGGKRFPILVMEWVDGPTLDVYIEEVINKPDVIKHIAEQWLNLIAVLSKANIAHGDLQHGNIIIERGRLRLVDLDGMYVPGMNGWEASEVGHQHYQHPRRDEKFFNSYLDNFSALVIYLSLISIAEKPSLWKKYHDENLLFIKADFLHPEKSPLFREIKEIGEEHRRLAEVLEQAAKDSPFLTPSLLELVEVKAEPNIPLWMTAPPEVDVVAKTREDTTIVIPRPQPKRIGTWTPWQGTGDLSLSQSGIQSNTVQTIFGSGAVKPANPKSLFSNTFFYANDIISKKIDFAVVAFATVIWFGSMCFSPWAFFIVPLIASGVLLSAGFIKAFDDYNTLQVPQLASASSQGLVMQPPASSFLGLFVREAKGSFIALGIALSVAVFAFVSGLFRFPFGVFVVFLFMLGNFRTAWRKADAAFNAQLTATTNSVNQLPSNSSQINSKPLPSQTSWSKQSLPLSTQAISTAPNIIGNAMFGIYHKDNCEWVNKIPPGRRVMFASVDEAEEKDYNPCHICFPQEEAKEKKTVSKETGTNNKTPVKSVSVSSQTTTARPAQSPSPKPVVKFVGNRLLGIYHKPDCEWAKKIPQSKKINFYSEGEAKKEKYRQCHVCSP